MKNKLIDLNNHLFMQLERLGDEDLTPDQIKEEVNRTNAIVAVSEQIVNNANLTLKAAVLGAKYGGNVAGALMIESKPAGEDQK